MTRDTLKKQLQCHADNIAKERDAMQKLLDEYAEVWRDSDEAIECLESAIEVLSRNI